MQLQANFTKWHEFFVQLSEEFCDDDRPDWVKPGEILDLNHPLTQMYNSPDVTGKDYVIRTFVEPVVSRIALAENSKKVIFNYDCTWNTKVIIQNSSPAPFGKGDKTVLDESVRKAFEIKAEKLAMEEDWFKSSNRLLYEKGEEEYTVRYNLNQWKGEKSPLCIISAFDKVESFLQFLAPKGKKLVPQLYKLQHYQKGGFFKEHCDTLHAKDHFATLIIFPPGQNFTGGELVLIDDNVKETFVANDPEKTVMVAFYTDLKHRVNLVISGERT